LGGDRNWSLNLKMPYLLLNTDFLDRDGGSDNPLVNKSVPFVLRLVHPKLYLNAVLIGQLVHESPANANVTEIVEDRQKICQRRGADNGEGLRG
jgi:hypothetical protein